MNISWSDLGSVRAPGDYPFRDGTIMVTVAELAIWSKTPDARFQLMRKHPIKAHIEYVLGRQVEQDHPALQGSATQDPGASELIYESSNGDIWCLMKDPITGARAVMHRPNTRSGGQISFIDVDKFLRESPEGPQHQALRTLLGPRD